MADQIDTDPRDDGIQTRYPYPLAATFHRAYYAAEYLDEIHDYLLDLFEVTLKYLTAIALAQYFKDGAGNAKLNRDLLNLQRPSLGHWQGWLRDILDLYRRERRPLLVPELADFYGKKSGGELLEAYNALKEIMVERMGYTGASRNPSAVSPQHFFDLLLEYRNKLAHGVRPSRYDKKEAAGVLMPAMRALLYDLQPLAEYRLVFVSEVQVDFAGGSPDAYRFAHRLTYLVGDRPRVSQKLQVLDSSPARARELYLLDRSAEFQPLLSLHPFLIFRHCESCNAEQAFVLNQTKEKTVDYISYQCTHHFSPTEYIDYMRSLLGGIREGDEDDILDGPAPGPETAAGGQAEVAPGRQADPMLVSAGADAPPAAGANLAGYMAATTPLSAPPAGGAATATRPLPAAAPSTGASTNGAGVQQAARLETGPPSAGATAGARPGLLAFAGVAALLVLVLGFLFAGPLLGNRAGGGVDPGRPPGEAPALSASAINAANAAQVTSLQVLEESSHWIESVSFSRDSRTLAFTSSGANAVRLFRAAGGEPVGALEAPTVLGAAFMPDGESILSAGLRELALWRIADGTRLRVFTGTIAPSFAFALSPDGSAAATDSSAQRTIRLVRLPDGQLVQTLRGHEGNIYSLAFSPDGRLLVSGSADKTVRLWRVEGGTLERAFEGHDADVKEVAFSPTGQLVASGSEDGTVRLWPLGGETSNRLEGHGDAVMSLAFSPDGQVLASGSRDNSIRLWRVADGRLLNTLEGHDSFVDALAFAPDGGILASGSGDNSVRLWGITP